MALKGRWLGGYQSWRLTKKEKQEIIRRYEEGQTISELARNYKVVRSTIYSMLYIRGVKLREPRIGTKPADAGEARTNQ